MEEATRYQDVNFDEVCGKLRALETFEQQIELLQDEYLCLYFLVSLKLEIDTSEYMDFCKGLEDDGELYLYYIHGWAIPQLDILRAQRKLRQGQTEKKIRGYKC